VTSLSTALRQATRPLLALAGMVLLGYTLSRLSRADLGAALLRVGPAALWTIPLWCAGMACNTMTLRALLPSPIGYAGLLHNRFISESYNNLLPLLGFGGEAFKVKYLQRWFTVEEAVGAMVQERLIDGVVDFFYTALMVALGTALLPLTTAGRDAS
jgi:hypothetical protein